MKARLEVTSPDAIEARITELEVSERAEREREREQERGETRGAGRENEWGGARARPLPRPAADPTAATHMGW